MLNKLFYCWRVLATGFCFALFGVGGLMLRVLVFPLLNVILFNPTTRIRAVRTIIRINFRMFVGVMHVLGVLRYELVGLQRLERHGLLILANHPTLIDTVFLMAFVQRADCIVKAELVNNFFMRGTLLAAGYVFNNDGVEIINEPSNRLNSLNRVRISTIALT